MNVRTAESRRLSDASLGSETMSSNSTRIGVYNYDGKNGESEEDAYPPRIDAHSQCGIRSPGPWSKGVSAGGARGCFDAISYTDTLSPTVVYSPRQLRVATGGVQGAEDGEVVRDEWSSRLVSTVCKDAIGGLDAFHSTCLSTRLVLIPLSFFFFFNQSLRPISRRLLPTHSFSIIPAA